MTNLRTAAGGVLWMLVATLMVFTALEPVTTAKAPTEVEMAEAAQCAPDATACDGARL